MTNQQQLRGAKQISLTAAIRDLQKDLRDRLNFGITLAQVKQDRERRKGGK